MTCILKSLYYDADQISNVSILTKVSVMQVECWIDSAKVPNVSIVLTFGLTSNEDTSHCSPNLGGGTALATGCWLLLARAALRRKFLFYLSLLTCGWLVAMVASSPVLCLDNPIRSVLPTIYGIHNTARIHYLYTLQGSNV